MSGVRKREFGFPIYAVEYSAALSALFVAGGGGPAKSGIKNSIVALKFNIETKELKELSHLSCNQEAPMALSIHPQLPEKLAVAVNDRIWLVELDSDDGLILEKSIQADFAKEDPYLKVIKFDSNGDTLVTAGNDNCVRLWNNINDTLELDQKINVFESEEEKISSKVERIEDLAVFASTTEQGVTAAIITPKNIHFRSIGKETTFTTISPLKGFNFRCASPLGPQGTLFVTIENPENFSSSSSSPIITIWDIATLSRKVSTKLSARLRVTALSISEMGTFIAVGTSDGSVFVYNDQLSRLYHCRELHKFIITSVSITELAGEVPILFVGSGDGSISLVEVKSSRSVLLLILILVAALLILIFSFLLLYPLHSDMI